MMREILILNMYAWSQSHWQGFHDCDGCDQEPPMGLVGIYNWVEKQPLMYAILYGWFDKTHLSLRKHVDSYLSA